MEWIPWLSNEHLHVRVISVVYQTLGNCEGLSALLALESSTFVFGISVFHNIFSVWVSEVAYVAACVELEVDSRNGRSENISTHLLFLLFFFLSNFEVFCVDITHLHPTGQEPLLSPKLQLLIVV